VTTHEATKVIDIHHHGIGRIDAQACPTDMLQLIDRFLSKEQVRAVITFFIMPEQLSCFEDVCKHYNHLRRSGELRYILGLALEGPLLASVGGAPRRAVWSPTKSEWSRIADLSSLGLMYCVLSPDAPLEPSQSTTYPHDMSWIVNALLDGGVKPALGHFLKDNPQRSVECIRTVLKVVDRRNKGIILTDHLYNDMPLHFKHTWRTSADKMLRERQLSEIELPSWSLSNLEARLGPIPAELIRGALAGLLKLSLNCDGAHVDIAVCKRTIEIVGSSNIMIMSDRVYGRNLAHQRLTRPRGSSLLYQEDGVVAAGTVSIKTQMANLRLSMVLEEDIRNVSFTVPHIMFEDWCRHGGPAI
jgi:N-acetylglucosamine-6-phosphate deacetylase